MKFQQRRNPSRPNASTELRVPASFSWVCGLALALATGAANAEVDAPEASEPVVGKTSDALPEEGSGVDWSAPPKPRAAAGGDVSAGGASVGLDHLLRLPKAYESSPGDDRGGVNENQWRSRFRESQEKTAEAKEALERSVEELESIAGDSGQYAVSPPGQVADPTASPVSFRLRQEIRRNRETVDEVTRKQRALVVEADLAGVPPDWREGSGDSAPESTPQSGAQ
jgi:hypothetical protein